MTDGDDLPDADYASIYGVEMLEARKHAEYVAMMAMLDRLHAKYDAYNAHLQAMIEQEKDRP